MSYKFSVCSGLLGQQQTRFVSYQPFRSLAEKFELAARIQGLDGLEVGYPGDFDDPQTLKDLLARFELDVSAVNLKLRGPAYMRNGSITSPDPQAVSTAIQWGKEAMDAAAELGCDLVTTCPLNDGFDYPFEMDYPTAWGQMVDGIRQVATHRGNVRLAIEYKLSDPRTRSLVSNVGESLTLARQTGQTNVGVNIDFGHALIARENPAQAASLAASEQRLFYVHINDNDRVADFDLMTGTVHFWETLEFFSYLPRLGYVGWMATDVFPKGLDPATVFSQTIAVQKRFVEAAKLVDEMELQTQLQNRDLVGVMQKLQAMIPVSV